MNPLNILTPMFILLAVACLFTLFWLNVALLSARAEQKKEAETARLTHH